MMKARRTCSLVDQSLDLIWQHYSYTSSRYASVCGSCVWSIPALQRASHAVFIDKAGCFCKRTECEMVKKMCLCVGQPWSMAFDVGSQPMFRNSVIPRLRFRLCCERFGNVSSRCSLAAPRIPRGRSCGGAGLTPAAAV
jgi:hypothetical protein